MRQFGFHDELAYAMDPFDAPEVLFRQFPIREGKLALLSVNLLGLSARPASSPRFAIWLNAKSTTIFKKALFGHLLQILRKPL
jgi:hypothetical protein